MGFTWNEKKARWYDRGVVLSNFPDVMLKFLKDFISPSDTVIDIGCGCGTLVLPLSKYAASVTALDSSEAMLAVLKEKLVRDRIKNVSCINSSFDDDMNIEQHDIVLSTNVFGLWADNPAAIKKAVDTAKKYICIVLPAGSKLDKFWFKELYPYLYGKEFYPKEDYLKIYSQIHDMHGILANVHIIDYNFDQPFEDLDEAVSFWKEYLEIENNEYDKKLALYLAGRLEESNGGLIARFPKKAAAIWWKKEV